MVDAVVNINVDLKEISQYRDNIISASLKRKMFTVSKAVVSVEQDWYLQTRYRRMFDISSTISPEMYEQIRSLTTLQSTTKNYSTSAVNAEIRKIMIPLTDQLVYDENHSHKTTTSTDDSSPWLARLLPQQSIIEYSQVDLPVTGIAVTISYLRNCKYLLLDCAEQLAQQ